eukprot:scaffold45034_cov40-Tisochrysis_lutea.AAC.1
MKRRPRNRNDLIGPAAQPPVLYFKRETSPAEHPMHCRIRESTLAIVARILFRSSFVVRYSS